RRRTPRRDPAGAAGQALRLPLGPGTALPLSVHHRSSPHHDPPNGHPMSATVTPIAEAQARHAAAAQPVAVPAQILAWFDGALVAADTLQAGLNTHAMHYGSGVFEGIRAYATAEGTAVFRLPEHLERMRQGAEMFGLPFDPAQCAQATLAT